jgi:glycosyltransferase involved in cell wall biosynthesis
MVIPPVVRLVDGKHEVEADCVNNLSAYLRSFSHVTFACPVSPDKVGSGILKSIPLDQIENRDRLTFIRLPYAYREDRYIRNYIKTKNLLKTEIEKADCLIFSPHGGYDWSTVAAELAIAMNRKYAAESDWDGENVMRLGLEGMPFGAQKLRKSLWMRRFVSRANNCFAHSDVALLQGQDVYNAYKDIAPNPKKVLNVQVSEEDYIPASKLEAKLAAIKAGKELTISYAGRMIEMKGPLEWLKAIHSVVESGIALQATWYGEGPLLAEMRQEVDRLNLGRHVALPGILNRQEVIERLWATDIFLFCHKTRESPRCLSESLAAGCPLVGYGSAFPEDLVARHGGGEFVELGDWKALGSRIVALDRDRPRLGRLVEAAAASGRTFDRDTAMQERIELIKAYVGEFRSQRAPAL